MRIVGESTSCLFKTESRVHFSLFWMNLLFTCDRTGNEILLDQFVLETFLSWSVSRQNSNCLLPKFCERSCCCDFAVNIIAYVLFGDWSELETRKL